MSTVADALRPLLTALLGPEPPIEVVLWDGSRLGSPSGAARVFFRDPHALRHVLLAAGDLGLGRAYVTGLIDVEGDEFEGLRAVARAAAGDRRVPPRVLAETAWRVRDLGVLGRPLPPPPEETRLHGRMHSVRRDAAAVSHHYDVSNDFYRLVLGPTMTYSCARFTRPDATLEEAQEAKYELICRKLGLQDGQTLLDVGCGWGGMVLHAARHHGVRAVGITASTAQSELARKRVADAGLADRVEIGLCDYRDVVGSFDAVSSIGMFEHVGRRNAGTYFAKLLSVLRPGGRLLNHAISKPGGSRLGRRSFMARYVFPDGELHDVGDVVLSMEAAGFEVRDVESLREHYALTLRHWVANLRDRWDEAVSMVGEWRARVWRIYMTGSAVSFEENAIAIHQVLGVRSGPDGSSGMPRTRAGWDDPAL